MDTEQVEEEANHNLLELVVPSGYFLHAWVLLEFASYARLYNPNI